MPFPFTEICTLLDQLEDNERHNGLLVREQKVNAKKIIESWFGSHRSKINELDVRGATALLSTLLPDWRTDRVYGAQSLRLSNIIGRALGLGYSEKNTLEAYKNPGAGDLGICLVRVLKSLGKPGIPFVTVEEVDELLQEWASLSTFSDPSVPKLSRSTSSTRDETFGYVLKRLEHENGKWIVRLILKDFSPVKIDEEVVLRNFHFLMPDLLRFQRDFHSAVTIIKNQLHEYPENPDTRSERLHRRLIDERVGFRPVVGTKVGRPNFNKARSLEHCFEMLKKYSWVVERKYDGEYCEVHVDLSRSAIPEQCIKIFSKSGKDSTRDRHGIISTLVQSLRLGKTECRFKEGVILLGELVVWSNRESRVLDFSEIRKHVTRSGRRLGANNDSQPKDDEHLAIVFFDLLLLDRDIVMNRPVEERRVWLRETYKKIRGRAMSADWKQIDFAEPQSKGRLINQFGASIAERCEGLVLKQCGVPYFSVEAPNRGYIKLKKDYIEGFGDEFDFAVIGGSYDALLAAATKMKNIKWTSFHLGCLMNKEDVRRVKARPIFKYVCTIDCEHCIPRGELEAANCVATFVSRPYNVRDCSNDFTVESNVPLKMDHAFFPPLIFEVLGSGFQNPSNRQFQMLRHPRVKKMHQDRAWEDCVTFQELQQGADAKTAIDTDSDEMIRWIERVERSCKAKMEREGMISSRSKRISTPNNPALSISPRSRSASAPRLPSSPLTQPKDFRGSRQPGKRPSEESTEKNICPDIKRPRLSTFGKTLPSPRSSPALVEISNNAEAASAQITARTGHCFNAVTSHATKFASLDRPMSQVDSQPDFGASAAKCAGSRCPFANAVIFAVACIANTPYIMEDLLSSHHISTVPSLGHWDRDSFAHEPLTEIVSESPSYPGMHKVILVERRRHAAVRSAVQELLHLNNQEFRERVDVYDWRVLEECQYHDRGPDLVKQHFLGATLFDDRQGRALFVSECEWL